MMRDTSIAKRLYHQYYVLRLDVESRDPIALAGRTYRYNAAEKRHELALLLGRENGNLTLPTTVVLSPRLALRHRHVGMLTVAQARVWLD